jgi:hypothetical protein
MPRPKAKLVHIQKAASKTNSKATRTPQQAQRRGSRTRGRPDLDSPIFIPCVLRGPDGKERPAWALWVKGVLIGRAESQDSLRRYYARLHEPPPSGHWRDHPQSPTRRSLVARRLRKRQDEAEVAELLDSEKEDWWE